MKVAESLNHSFMSVLLTHPTMLPTFRVPLYSNRLLAAVKITFLAAIEMKAVRFDGKSDVC